MKKFIFIIMLALVGLSANGQQITILKPAIVLDTNAVCVGSVIDVPFYSYGVYNSGNIYTAQLSDSSGNFATFSIIGNLPDSTNHDSTLGALPGIVSGFIPDVPNGCNYYIRIISSSPSVIGIVYGPFCIQHCDIKPNNGENIHLCLSPNTVEIDTPISIHVHTWDNVQTYNSGNQFKIELLDTLTYNPVGTIGALGSVTATHDTTLMLIIPPLVTLQSMGINPGPYYLRIIASNVQYTDSSLSSLIGFTIGAPADNPPTTLLYDYSTFIQLSSDTICNTETIYFEPNPFNSNSNYKWTSAQLLGSPLTQQTLAVLFTGFTGDFIWTLQEINYGCYGSVNTPDTLFVFSYPDCLTVGIQELSSNNSISLYPNPTSGIFTLSYHLPNSQLYALQAQFKIYDVAGREVYSQPIINQESSIINVSGLSNGIYFYQLINKDETYRGKFVKE